MVLFISFCVDELCSPLSSSLPTVNTPYTEDTLSSQRGWEMHRSCTSVRHIVVLFLIALLSVIQAKTPLAPAGYSRLLGKISHHQESNEEKMEIKRESINCPTISPAIGPYSHAVRAGDFLFVSGSIGMNPETRALAPGGVGPQTRQVMENMKAVVEHAGSNMSKVVKCTILLADMASFAEVNAIYGEYFPENPPARATYAVAGLPVGALVEIECVCIA